MGKKINRYKEWRFISNNPDYLILRMNKVTNLYADTWVF